MDELIIEYYAKHMSHCLSSFHKVQTSPIHSVIIRRTLFFVVVAT